jgi:hypothetical protein
VVPERTSGPKKKYTPSSDGFLDCFGRFISHFFTSTGCIYRILVLFHPKTYQFYVMDWSPSQADDEEARESQNRAKWQKISKTIRAMVEAAEKVNECVVTV